MYRKESKVMNYDIVEALGQIAREKGVDLQVLKDRVEASLLSAARKNDLECQAGRVERLHDALDLHERDFPLIHLGSREARRVTDAIRAT